MPMIGGVVIDFGEMLSVHIQVDLAPLDYDCELVRYILASPEARSRIGRQCLLDLVVMHEVESVTSIDTHVEVIEGIGCIVRPEDKSTSVAVENPHIYLISE